MHRRILQLAILGLSAASTSFSQSYFPGTSLMNQAAFMGGVGFSVIDGETFVTVHLRPELAIGKFGIGFDVPLRYSTDTGRLRTEDWNDDYDYFRILRYVRYGHKREPFYARVGALDAARLGHGFIMNYYNNSLLYDQRKIGLELDIDAKHVGFESMTSNLGRSEIFGGRVYYRPLWEMRTPIVKNLAVGATFVTDNDPDASRDTDDGITEFGFDAELPFIKTSALQLGVYADFATINNFGSGVAVGVEFQMRGIAGVFDFTAQLERRFLGDEFLPAYFGPFYELERYQVDGDTVYIKKQSLRGVEETHGTYGLLYGHVLNAVQLLGTFEKLDEQPNSGRLHLEATLPNTLPKIAARAMYDRRNIDGLGDAFDFDEDTVARAGLGYKIAPFVILYGDYVWTFRFDEASQKYKVQKRFEPQISLSFTFGVGGR